MITGGTGSFGKAVLKRFINSDFQKSVYLVEMKKARRFRISLNNEKIKFYIAM